MLCLTLVFAAFAAAVELTVTTRTGTFIGGLNETYPDVRHFKWVPYAQPPVGNLRWTPPRPLVNDSTVYESTTFGPACSQFVSAVPAVWSLNITGNLIVNYGESLTAGLVAQNSAEDCLSLAIWTPANATGNSSLPVIIFTTGGGDQTGGINIPTQIPANWVHRSQKHIVVTINYRVNIFGYPNARGLNGSTNFAIQDQRAAVEWVSENIAAFGGDPARLTLWGQSAGAGLTDEYLFAWPSDPIVRASISSSSLAIGYPTNVDYAGTNFTFVAQAMGCNFTDPAFELQCMRRVPMPRIVNFVGQYQDNSSLVNTSQRAISFSRQIDNKFVFSQADYVRLYQADTLAQIPKMIGTTAREFSALLPYPVNNASAGPSNQLITALTQAWVCTAYNTSVYRQQDLLTTYRYEYAANFTNLADGASWLGAYHYADLYMFFGTYLITSPPYPDLEVQTSQIMQDLLYNFVANPASLPGNGWPPYLLDSSDSGGQIARFGANGQALQLVSGNAIDGACHLPNYTYTTTP
ncbi:hypothetical protein BAUCODRAFT_388676 [Baudoinia panamericana UAMH 10762]|uniref:Carboxylic ester hydrolase n=1 Tax=Baudoinia panamericana (strain UAMH 10762) TaxID=717646 RepID=M2N4X9_BAUPA|nr:uncharacterized protein BAUCODRAFT_388676 [Baudoinia panamericana UAMH 10762]EMC99033.1 hypothetical protein BAUCODRAFT_388676 [Baudoinia panamericana UAMH 10762]